MMPLRVSFSRLGQSSSMSSIRRSFGVEVGKPNSSSELRSTIKMKRERKSTGEVPRSDDFRDQTLGRLQPNDRS